MHEYTQCMWIIERGAYDLPEPTNGSANGENKNDGCDEGKRYESNRSPEEQPSLGHENGNDLMIHTEKSGLADIE